MTLKPVGSNVIVVQYEKPQETAGGIVIPDTSRRDTSGQLWEVIQASEASEEEVGCSLPEGTILKTRWGTGVDLGRDHSDGRPLFVVNAERVFNVLYY